MDERTKTIDSIVRNKGGTWAAAAAAYDAGQAAERERWQKACGSIAGDLRNQNMVRLGAAKCLGAGNRA